MRNREFSRAIGLSPELDTPYRQHGAAELTAGRNEDAIKKLQQGIKASNDAPPLEGYLPAFTNDWVGG